MRSDIGFGCGRVVFPPARDPHPTSRSARCPCGLTRPARVPRQDRWRPNSRRPHSSAIAEIHSALVGESRNFAAATGSTLLTFRRLSKRGLDFAAQVKTALRSSLIEVASEPATLASAPSRTAWMASLLSSGGNDFATAKAAFASSVAQALKGGDLRLRLRILGQASASAAPVPQSSLGRACESSL